MQIVTDSGADLGLSADERAALGIHVVPLVVTIGGRSYREGVDLDPDAFYPMLAASDELPTTSQPSPGDMAETYRRLAADDPEILSIHMSSGLSGTYASSLAAAEMVPEARVTHFDTKTLSMAAGWQVEACARAIQAGWDIERVLALATRIRAATDTVFTIRELRYLIHGGRISHMKGLIASLLNIKPIIGVAPADGSYEQRGQARSFKGAVKALAAQIPEIHGEGTQLRAQVAHSSDPEGADALQAAVDARCDCAWLPTGRLSLVLAAHTGETMVGVATAPEAVFAEVPAA